MLNSRVLKKEKIKSFISYLNVVTSNLLYFRLLIMCVSVIFFMYAVSFLVLSNNLSTLAKNNFDKNIEIEKINSKISTLEIERAELLDIRNIQKKASELGFVHNNEVVYVK